MFNLGAAPKLSCGRCAKSLAATDFEFDRAMMLLGSPYCSGCLKDFRRVCRLCRKPLCREDFESGRALTLGNDLYCDGCLEEALRNSHPATVLHPSVVQRLAELAHEDDPPVPEVRPIAAETRAPKAAPKGEWESRRATVRFMPPRDCCLSMRPSGIKGLFGGSAVRLWVDVSEGGLRAVLRGPFKVGDRVQGNLAHPTLKGGLGFRAEVRYGKPSEKYPGCTLVGFKFEKPSATLVSFIRVLLGRDIPKPLSPQQAPPPARSA